MSNVLSGSNQRGLVRISPTVGLTVEEPEDCANCRWNWRLSRSISPTSDRSRGSFTNGPAIGQSVWQNIVTRPVVPPVPLAASSTDSPSPCSPRKGPGNWYCAGSLLLKSQVNTATVVEGAMAAVG